MTVCAESLQQYQETGDPEAFRQLHDQFNRCVRKFLARYVCREDLDDCLQNFWLAVARTPAKYDPERRPIQSWLLGIAAREVKKWYDHTAAKKRGGHAKKLCINGGIVDPTTRGNPPELYELSNQIQAAIATLSDVQQLYVREHFYRGYSYAEIAANHGIALGTLKWHARRAIKQLQRQLARHYSKGWPQQHRRICEDLPRGQSDRVQVKY